MSSFGCGQWMITVSRSWARISWSWCSARRARRVRSRRRNDWRSGLGTIMHFEKLKTFLEERKEPTYRLAQAKRAFFIELRRSWEEVSVFPKALREACAEAVPWDELSVV